MRNYFFFQAVFVLLTLGGGNLNQVKAQSLFPQVQTTIDLVQEQITFVNSSDESICIAYAAYVIIHQDCLLLRQGEVVLGPKQTIVISVDVPDGPIEDASVQLSSCSNLTLLYDEDQCEPALTQVK